MVRGHGMDKNEVHSAFEILLEEIEAVVTGLNEEGAEAFQGGSHERAVKLAQDAIRLTDFHDKVKGLQAEWQTLFAETTPPRPKKGGKRKGTARLARGMRTPEEAFRQPILASLMDLGGSAPLADVLDAVGKRMAAVLNKHDRQRLTSGPTHEVRWRNSAMWCRYKMVRDGLLKSGSPRGMWEISEKGRKALEKGEV